MKSSMHGVNTNHYNDSFQLWIVTDPQVLLVHAGVFTLKEPNTTNCQNPLCGNLFKRAPEKELF